MSSPRKSISPHKPIVKLLTGSRFPSLALLLAGLVFLSKGLSGQMVMDVDHEMEAAKARKSLPHTPSSRAARTGSNPSPPVTTTPICTSTDHV
jgi:hypothetical protein